ncbi:hypothetical protein BDB01DRAFT_247178 [Pilobolus umbonatus]|nr:hypothetical protein BDB01DRAFT_247178 [Pilobolus umbonatus]
MGSQNAPTEIKVSHRVFALKQEEKEAKEDDFMHQKYNTEADTPEQPIPDIFSFTNSSVSSESEVTESDSDSLSPIELNDTDHPIPAIDNNQQRQDNHPAIIPTESYQIPSSMDTNTNHGDMKTLQSTIDAHTTSPDQHSTHPHSHPHAEPSFQLSDNTSHKYSSSVPHRRPSVVDLLGDKFENFSEKLAFIKKNILMSMDSDGEDTDDEYRASDTNHSSKRQRDISKPSWDPFTEIRSKHFRDEDKALDVYPANNSPYETPVGIQPLNYNDTVIRDAELINKMSKKTDEAQIKGSRYSARDSSMFSSSREVSDDENDEENDDDDIFDLSKVVAMSKNVRNFSEEVMGNGIRMFSDLSSRIKNANTQYHNR